VAVKSTCRFLFSGLSSALGMTNAIANDYTRMATRLVRRGSRRGVRLNWIFILAMVLNLAFWGAVIALAIRFF
jgi:hypothetical protein